MNKKKIVILGGGYGGVAAARECEKIFNNSDDVECTIIEKNKYHTLMTQLHELAGGRVSTRDVRITYKTIFKKKKKFSIQLFCDSIIEINFQEKSVCSIERVYNFDYLIIATGSKPEVFNIKGVAEKAYKLWGLTEAITIKERIEDSFYLACHAKTSDEKKALLTFVVAGGGFTGVELVGELAYFCKKMSKIHEIEKSEVNICLVEAADRVLSVLDEKQVWTAMKYLKKIGVTVFTNAKIKAVENTKIYFEDGSVIAGSLFWSAGIKGNPYIQRANIAIDNRSRVIANEFLQSISYENVFCVGDAVSFNLANRQSTQVVENALQSGKLAAQNIKALIKNENMKTYEPRFHGSMISIGPFYGVAKLGFVRVKWLFATILKHLVNIHYHFMLAGVSQIARYINAQFLGNKW